MLDRVLYSAALQLAITPITGASLGMRHGDDINSILVMSEDNLKRKFQHAAGAVTMVNADEPFWIGLDAGNRNI